MTFPRWVITVRRDMGTVVATTIDQWFLATTAPNAEQSVARRLAELSFPHHLFKIKREQIDRGSRIEKILPAFPRYIFVVTRNAWTQICEISGVLGFVKCDGSPAPVRRCVVRSLVQQSDDADILERPALIEASQFQHGDKVTIGGPSSAAGHQGLFQYYLEQGMTVVLMEWMGRWVPISVEERDLQLVLKKNKRKRYRKGHRSSGSLPH